MQIQKIYERRGRGVAFGRYVSRNPLVWRGIYNDVQTDVGGGHKEIRKREEKKKERRKYKKKKRREEEEKKRRRGKGRVTIKQRQVVVIAPVAPTWYPLPRQPY